MRGAAIVAAGLVLLVGIAVAVTLADGDGAVPPAPAGDTRPAAPAEPAPPVPDRAPIERGAGATEAPPGAGDVVPETAPAARAELPANVELRVRSIGAHTDVPAFRWRFQGGETRLRGEGTAGRAALRLPPLARGELHIEADGWTPATIEVTAPADGAPPAVAEVFLAGAAEATGITLLVRDPALTPVPHVRVDVFPLQPGTEDQSWHLCGALWARRTAAADGRYELPELAPGHYGIRVLATDADGELLPFLAYRRAFTLTGSNGFVEEVALEPGCVIAIELVDAAGTPLDPSRAGAVQLALDPTGGAEVHRLWSVRSADGTTNALDALPAAGTVSPAEPVAEGTYTFAVSIAGAPRVQQYLTLHAGERRHERIVVP